jgi:DNA polymerase III delta subunit
VRCTRPNEADTIAWVRRHSGLDVELAVRLLNRVEWNLSAAHDACRKLALFDGIHSPAAVDAVCTGGTRTLVDCLLTDDKRRALAVVDQLDAAALALLATRVDTLGRLWTYVRAGVPVREMRDVAPFLIAEYLPLAGKWHPQRCAHARRVLAVVEDAYRNGARSAVGEALVALW